MLSLMVKCSEFWRKLRLTSPLTIIASGFLATVCLGLLAFFLPNLMVEKSARPPFRLIEVRAVSDDGQLIPGASVKLGKSKEGLTDAFGEWRRFIRIREGSQLSVKVVKSGKNGYWYGYRRLNVGIDSAERKNIRFALGITMRWIAKQNGKEDAEFGDEFIVSDSQDVLNRKNLSQDQEKNMPHSSHIDNRIAVFFDSSGIDLTNREAWQQFNLGEITVKRELITKGFTSDNKAPLQLHVSALKGDMSSNWLEARLVWSANEKTQEIGEIIKVGLTSESIAPKILQFFEREFPARWRGEVLSDGKVVIRIPLQGKSPVSLALGDKVQDLNFSRGMVEGAAIRNQVMHVMLARVDAAFCAAAATCDLRKMNPNQERTFVLKSVTLDVPDARVYVGGRLARPVGNQVFEYHGQQGRSFPVSIVRKYVLISRGNVTAFGPSKQVTNHQSRAFTRKR